MITKIEEDKIILQAQGEYEINQITKLKENKFFDTVYFLSVIDGTLIFGPMTPKKHDEPTKEVFVEDVVKETSLEDYLNVKQIIG
jgi:hypothetical protein